MDASKIQALKLLSQALQSATDCGLFDDEMLGAVRDADSINDFCDAVAYLEKKDHV